MTTTYKPRPGSIASRVLELLRFLPKGTAVYSSDLCRRLELHPNFGIASSLKPAVRHGLVRYEKRSGRSAKAWLIGNGVPSQQPAIRPVRVRRSAPFGACPAARSVFDLGARLAA